MLRRGISNLFKMYSLTADLLPSQSLLELTGPMLQQAELIGSRGEVNHLVRRLCERHLSLAVSTKSHWCLSAETHHAFPHEARPCAENDAVED